MHTVPSNHQNKRPLFRNGAAFSLKMGLTCLGLSTLFSSSAQKQFLSRALQVENENDAYTLNLTRDQYYTNGVALRYRMVKDTLPTGSSLRKVVRSYELHHRIYTPKRLGWTQLEQLDRPYAGQLTVAFAHLYFYEKAFLKAQAEVGWMGPSLKTGDLQYNWHKTFGMQLPLAWQYEINDGPIFNLYGTYATTLFSASGLDLIVESNLAVGTTFSNLRQDLVLRIGNIKPIHTSTQYNGAVGLKNQPRGFREFYLFISPGVEYVAYNATIEGQLIGQSSFYTETRVPWVHQHRIGLLASWVAFDFGLIYYYRTKETTEATPHRYVGIRMAQRF